MSSIDQWARQTGDRMIIDEMQTMLDRTDALTERLVRSSLEINVCACCGTDLLAGQTFRERHFDPDACELVLALSANVEVLLGLRGGPDRLKSRRPPRR